MTQHKDIGPLKNNRLFSGVDTSGLKVKIRQNSFSSFREGDVIYQKGDASENIFLIIDGEVKLKIHSSDSGQNVFRKGKNDFFGEAEFFEKTPRDSFAVANTECILYSFSRQEIYELTSADKKINRNLKGETEEEIEEEVSEENSGFNLAEENQSEMESDENETSENLPLVADDEGDIPFEVDDSSSEEDLTFTPEEPVQEEASPMTDEPEKFEENDAAFDENEKSLREIESEIEEEEIEHSIFADALESGINLGDESFHEENVPETTNNNEDLTEKEITGDETENIIPSIDSFDPKTIDYQKVIQAVRKIYSGNGLEGSVRSVIEALFELIEPQVIRVFVAENEAGELWSYPFMDNSGEIKRIRYGEGLIGCSAAGKEIINLNEPMSDSRFKASSDALENIIIEDMILFPVLDENKNLSAVVQMINSGKYGFSSGDIDTLNYISTDISSSIKNAREDFKVEEKPAPQMQSVPEAAQQNEIFYFDKASEFLNSNEKISLSLIKRMADFIKKKSDAEDIKHAAVMASNQTDSADRFITLVADFFNGKTALKKEITGMRDTLNEILEQLAEFVESKNVKLFKKCSADSRVNIDKTALYHAFFQIVKNSCDAMPEGGNIYITCSQEEKNVLIEIRDTGKGIDSEAMDKLFEPFFSYPEGKNPGLGLAVASKIVKDHGGELKAERNSVEGAVFNITLPAVE